MNFEHFSHLILDEIHERNIEMDFLQGVQFILKQFS
jgi:HrpA-like RNA helicase